jgi:hypothetical protein
MIKGENIQAGSYFCKNDGIGFTDGDTGLASQAILRPGRISLSRHLKNIPLANPKALSASFTPVLFHMNQIDFEILEFPHTPIS